MSTDKLDLVPQVPADWANHIVYGGAGGLVFLAAFAIEGLGDAASLAALAVLGVAVVKKAWDYLHEGESAGVCICKALVTAAWPASIAAVVAMVA